MGKVILLENEIIIISCMTPSTPSSSSSSSIMTLCAMSHNKKVSIIHALDYLKINTIGESTYFLNIFITTLRKTYPDSLFVFAGENNIGFHAEHFYQYSKEIDKNIDFYSSCTDRKGVFMSGDVLKIMINMLKTKVDNKEILHGDSFHEWFHTKKESCEEFDLLFEEKNMTHDLLLVVGMNLFIWKNYK